MVEKGLVFLAVAPDLVLRVDRVSNEEGGFSGHRQGSMEVESVTGTLWPDTQIGCPFRDHLVSSTIAPREETTWFVKVHKRHGRKGGEA